MDQLQTKMLGPEQNQGRAETWDIYRVDKSCVEQHI